MYSGTIKCCCCKNSAIYFLGWIMKKNRVSKKHEEILGYVCDICINDVISEYMDICDEKQIYPIHKKIYEIFGLVSGRNQKKDCQFIVPETNPNNFVSLSTIEKVEVDFQQVLIKNMCIFDSKTMAPYIRIKEGKYIVPICDARVDISQKIQKYINLEDLCRVNDVNFEEIILLLSDKFESILSWKQNVK